MADEKGLAMRAKWAWLVPALVTVAVLGLWGQQNTAPPPNPNAGSNDNGPSLADTMKFIQDKLTENGTVNYSFTVRGAYGYTRNDRVEVSKVVADSKTCQLSFHYKETNGSEVSADLDYAINFKDAQKVEVTSVAQYQRSGGGDVSTDPAIFMLTVKGRGNRILSGFELDDEDMTNRLAKAMVRAVELCTPPQKSEPF